ncbi:hypothetical protein D9619_002365 [Psilocybe cf. subviscida]|uniref:Thioredoxin domain-containing protein n=1 Tax=Psilocybe cf. subviscida TaxID=2480587 RepID=A0A8H5AYG0_9AGAR|nr:hypothetical protein D9619_002365 [Psilocybe cf. subviscida]
MCRHAFWIRSACRERSHQRSHRGHTLYFSFRFQMSTSAKSLPDEHTLAAATELEVVDLNGKRVRFGDLFNDRKSIVVFIRHFFCGTCQGQAHFIHPYQNYAKHLAAVSTETLEAAGVQIVLIGCGEYTLIKNYAEETGFRGEIYANPTRSVYHALGMNLETLRMTPSTDEKRSYIPDSRLLNTVSATVRALKHPTLVGKQGNMSQVGGEFIFGPGNTCSFASRMQHTEDRKVLQVLPLLKTESLLT